MLGALAGLTVVSTALAFVAFFALIREVGTARAMVFTYVNPAVAVAAGVLVLAEPLTPSILAAFRADHGRVAAGHGGATGPDDGPDEHGRAGSSAASTISRRAGRGRG